MRNETEKTIIEGFLKTPLFKECDISKAYRVLEEKANIRTYSSGSTIMSNGKLIEKGKEASPSITYVHKGKCLISSISKSRSVLRMAEEKELIGLASVFLGKEIETKVVASGGKKVVALSLDLDGLNALMKEDETNSIRDNLFKMLANKVSFLNKKIATLTGGSSKKKLAMFLLSFEKDEFNMGLSMSALSSMLDIGRSSLYRGMDELESKGIIKRNDDIITILDRDQLTAL